MQDIGERLGEKLGGNDNGTFRNVMLRNDATEKNAAEKLFNLQQFEGFSFDVEILYLAKKHGLKTIQIPIIWEHKNQSKINSMRDSFKMLKDVLKIRIAHKNT